MQSICKIDFSYKLNAHIGKKKLPKIVYLMTTTHLYTMPDFRWHHIVAILFMIRGDQNQRHKISVSILLLLFYYDLPHQHFRIPLACHLIDCFVSGRTNKKL